MRKLSDKEKAELQAKMERARTERVRRIVEQSEEGASPDIGIGGVFDGLAALLRAIFRRRDSDIVDRMPKRPPRAFPVWFALLAPWLLGLLFVIPGI